jgi:hypothetical protein
MLHGVIVYDILNNNCLTGTWTNDHHHVVLTDSARKVSGSTTDIDGEYTCSYIDIDMRANSGTLSVSRAPVPQEYQNLLTQPTYLFEWQITNTPNPPIRFSGIGFKFEEHKIAVSYKGH